MIEPTLGLDEAVARDWDVVVIGAGPAGSLAARQIAAGGASVLLVDKKGFPRWKVCGACLNGKALDALRTAGLGALVERLGGLDLSGFDVHLAGRAAWFPLPAGKALARDRLDVALVEAAVAAGAHFLPEATARLVAPGEATRTVRLDCQSRQATVEARVVLVASGLAGNSLEVEPGLRTQIAARSRIGAGCVVSEFPGSYGEGTIHMAVGRSGYVGLVRVAGGMLNVAAAFDRDFVRDRGGPAAAAAAVLDEAGVAPVAALAAASWHGTVPLTRHTRPVAAHRLFLLGDAAGYVEPFTGEGMGAAFTSALAVAPLALRAARAWDPALARAWVGVHGRRIGRQEFLCRGLATAARHPWLARVVFGIVVRSPFLARAMTRRVHTPFVPLEAT
jgi:flavin-dependent dehydrogenase